LDGLGELHIKHILNGSYDIGHTRAHRHICIYHFQYLLLSK